MTAGFDPSDVCEVVGLPEMGVVEKAVQAPALPPGWVPEVPAAPAEPSAPAAPASGGDDEDMENLLRRTAAWNALEVRR